MSIADSRILLWRFGGLGDLLTALPSMVYLRKIFSGRFFSLVGREEYGGLFLKAGIVDSVIAADGPRIRPLFAGLRQDGPDVLRGSAGDVDFSVGWMQRPPDPAMNEALGSPDMPPFHWITLPGTLSIPVSRHFFEMTRTHFPDKNRTEAAFEDCAKLTLNETALPAKGILRSRPPQEKAYAVVHPGSGGESKRWPLENFQEIIRRLARKEIPGILVTGEAEGRMSGILEATRLPGGWSWIRQPSLLRLARLLSGAAFYLGNDSGVTHLAAACGTSVLALFREDLEPAWRPFGRTRVLASRSLPEISSDSVWREIEEMSEVFSCF